MPGRKDAVRAESRLDCLADIFGVAVDKAAVDRILPIISLTGTTGVLAPGVDATALDAETAAAIKRTLWGGELLTILQFLACIVERRKLSTPKALEKVRKASSAGLSATDIALKVLDPVSPDKLTAHVLQLMEHSREWTNEVIAGEFLPAQYSAIFWKRPTMTRGGEAVRFVQAVMRELGIKVVYKGKRRDYSEESIISAMTKARKPKRRR